MDKKIVFYNTLKRPNKKDFLEGDFPPSIVQAEGHLTMKQRIQNFMQGGERLLQIRKANYDAEYDPSHPDLERDITRSQDFDRIDALALARQLSHRMEKTLKDQKKAKEGRENASQDPVEASPVDVEPVKPADVQELDNAPGKKAKK